MYSCPSAFTVDWFQDMPDTKILGCLRPTAGALYPQFHTCAFNQLQFVVLCVFTGKKKSVYKWTQAFQTHAVQGSTAVNLLILFFMDYALYFLKKSFLT